MIIDFHTHIFPDKIAEACVNSLTERSGEPHFSDGKESSLIEQLDEAGVDFSVNLPVLTKKEQFVSITAFGAALNEKFYRGGRILSFGGIHPEDENYAFSESRYTRTISTSVSTPTDLSELSVWLNPSDSSL